MRLPGYRGNTNLKRPNLQIEWTPEMIQEWIKCSEDPIYFIETYLSIVDADGELVPFKLRDYQKEIILSYKNNRRTIVGTARQAGKCLASETPINIRNKNTGEVMNITIGEFYELQRMREDDRKLE